MQSNGGLMTDAAAAAPGRCTSSSRARRPASSAPRRWPGSIGLGKLITFDMGGTTAKASIVEDGEVSRATEYQVGGGIMHGSRLLDRRRLPAARARDRSRRGRRGRRLASSGVDAGGALQVGPRSAGASPGPLCYDLGGTEPTVTDANVILGYLNPTALAGGAVKLNAAPRARGLRGAGGRGRSGLPLAEAAYGAHLIAASNMMRAIRAVSSERGRDPREYALFAFGGNGPLFAAGMARALEMTRVVVPPAPGLFSAFGLLYADVEHHYVRTWRRRCARPGPGRAGRVLRTHWRPRRAPSSPPRASAATAVRIARSADCATRASRSS